MTDTNKIVVAIYRVGSSIMLAATFGFMVVGSEINTMAYWLAVIMAFYMFILGILADLNNK